MQPVFWNKTFNLDLGKNEIENMITNFAFGETQITVNLVPFTLPRDLLILNMVAKRNVDRL